MFEFERWPSGTYFVGIKSDEAPFHPYSHQIYLTGEEQAEALALAMLDDLGKGWKPYPENKPTYDLYNVTLNGGFVKFATYIPQTGHWLDEVTGVNITSVVIAYRELPAPYQPKEEK